MLTDRAQGQEQQLTTLQERVTLGERLEQEARLGQEQATTCRKEAEVLCDTQPQATLLKWMLLDSHTKDWNTLRFSSSLPLSHFHKETVPHTLSLQASVPCLKQIHLHGAVVSNVRVCTAHQNFQTTTIHVQ